MSARSAKLGGINGIYLHPIMGMRARGSICFSRFIETISSVAGE